MTIAVRGTSVDIPAADGIADAYLAHPDDGRAHPAVLLYMNAFGLRPFLESLAERLAAEGYTVLVPNVFYRLGRAPVVALPERPELINPATDPTLLEQLGPIMASFTAEQAVRDAGAYLDWLARSPLTVDGPVGITGYCLGAQLALRTAGACPDRVAAAAGFHGGMFATDEEDSPTWSPARSRRSCTSGTPTRTRRFRPTRSTAWPRPWRRPASGTPARSTRARRTASPRPTPPPTIRRRPPGTGTRCSPCSSARSDAGAAEKQKAVRVDVPLLGGAAVSVARARLLPMSLADLPLDQWRSYDLPAARGVARAAADAH